MKPIVLCLLLCLSASAAQGQGLLKTLCCWRHYYGPYYGCHGGCDPNCMSGCMAGPNGCGERYWGDFWDPPPECCEPCDGLGNWAGRGGPCYPARPLLKLVFGVPYWPGTCGGAGCGACGDCYDSGCADGGCTSCGGTYPGGDYADLGGYFTGPRPGCASCGHGGGNYSSAPMMEYSGPQGSPTPAAAPTPAPQAAPEGASSYYQAPRMPPKYHSATRRPASRAPQVPGSRMSHKPRSTLAPVQYQTTSRSSAPPGRPSSQPRVPSHVRR